MIELYFVLMMSFLFIFGIAALNTFYPILIKSLPSNHLITLLRLQAIAFVPKEIVDSIVPSPSAEIGNKMIINYLIGLIHTEEHIITFCRLVKRMTGEFDKCIAVLNLLNCKLSYLSSSSVKIYCACVCTCVHLLWMNLYHCHTCLYYAWYDILGYFHCFQFICSF